MMMDDDSCGLAESMSCGLVPNALRGMLPATWPRSMTFLVVQENPELAGKISPELVLQCSDGIEYSDCKRWFDKFCIDQTNLAANQCLG